MDPLRNDSVLWTLAAFVITTVPLPGTTGVAEASLQWTKKPCPAGQYWEWEPPPPDGYTLKFPAGPSQNQALGSVLVQPGVSREMSTALV
jgi:hypothetical protein